MELPLTVSVAATEGARERFERLLGPELDRAYQLSGYLLGQASQAEDATGEAVARAWACLDGLRDEGRFRPWLTGSL